MPTVQPGPACGRRIVVTGTTGCGKTTMAQQLSLRLGLPHVELDGLYWGPNWAASPPEVFRARVVDALSADAWVVDGNYGVVRDAIWSRIDTAVWLDFPLPLILLRLLRRGVRRAATREELWNGNRETWRGQFFSRDSLFVWALHTYRRRRRTYLDLFARPEYAHVIRVRLCSPRAARLWLAEVA